MRPETAESARPGSPSPRERRVRRVLHVTNMFPTPARPGFGIIVQRIVEALRAAVGPGAPPERRATVLLFSTRLASFPRADRIAVLERGRIVETGDHAQLLAAGGVYARIFRAQHDLVGRPRQPALSASGESAVPEAAR